MYYIYGVSRSSLLIQSTDMECPGHPYVAMESTDSRVKEPEGLERLSIDCSRLTQY